MRHSKQLLESQVVSDYLKAKPRNKIAVDNRTSAGNVSNILKDWKKRIGIPNVEELREFVVAVKKSGITIEQCAQGFRTAQAMKNLGIPVDGNDDCNDDSHNNNKDFYFFVDEIYLNCKNLGIPPDIIPSWIKDLLDCYDLDNTNQQSLSRSLGEHDDNRNDGEKDPSLSTLKEQENLTQGKTRSGSIEIRKTDSFNKDSSNHFETDQLASSPNNVKIPLISRISNFIEIKKKECVKLYRHRLALDEVKGLKLQKDKGKRRSL